MAKEVEFKNYWGEKDPDDPEVMRDLKRQAYANVFHILKGGKCTETRRKTSEAVFNRMIPERTENETRVLITWESIEAAKRRVPGYKDPITLGSGQTDTVPTIVLEPHNTENK